LALKWLSSYLKNRQQSVIVRNERSECQEVTCGVPQGSVLGPLLFTLYTSGLGRVIKNHLCKYHLYADDTQIYVTTTPEELPNAIKDLEVCIMNVREWLCRHCLKLNETKTEFMLFSTRQMAHHLQGIKLDMMDTRFCLLKE
jgi:retron-type reverse transcriptase